MRILLATDGSENARVAGRLLATLPLNADMHVTTLSAAAGTAWLSPPAPGLPGASYPWLEELRREEAQAARCAAEDIAAPLRERGIDVSVCVRHERPAEAILQQAKADEADLIVVGSRGMGTMEGLLVGSVSERVARYASCSVLVARGESIRRVLVAFDGSASSEQALEALLQLPLPRQTEFWVAHIAPADEAGAQEITGCVDLEAAIAEYDRECHDGGHDVVREAIGRLSAAGRPANSYVHCGSPAEELVTAVRTREADLLVVGAENRSLSGSSFLGSVSQGVLSHAPCSVLVGRALDHMTGP